MHWLWILLTFLPTPSYATTPQGDSRCVTLVEGLLVSEIAGNAITKLFSDPETLPPLDSPLPAQLQNILDQIAQTTDVPLLTLKKKELSQYRFGAIVQFDRPFSIFEENEFLPLPLLPIHLGAASFEEALKDLENKTNSWMRRLLAYHPLSHSKPEVPLTPKAPLTPDQKRTYFGHYVHTQIAYRRARNIWLKNPKKLALIDWVFHSVKWKTDNNIASGPDGIIRLLRRIGSESEEQLVFTEELRILLATLWGFRLGLTKEELYWARDQLVTAFLTK